MGDLILSILEWMIVPLADLVGLGRLAERRGTPVGPLTVSLFLFAVVVIGGVLWEWRLTLAAWSPQAFWLLAFTWFLGVLFLVALTAVWLLGRRANMRNGVGSG